MMISGFLGNPVFAAGGYGGYAHKYIDYAKVVHVQPVYRVVQVNKPRRECWREKVVHHHKTGDAGTRTILGGIIGGAIGNRFGKGHGRHAATIAGALLGGSIARDMSKTSYAGKSYVESRRVCSFRDHYVEEEQLDGYRVTYRYKGQTYTTHMDHQPGKRVRVKVKVALAE
jgi:uncharacterized protein YcfJ